MNKISIAVFVLVIVGSFQICTNAYSKLSPVGSNDTVEWGKRDLEAPGTTSGWRESTNSVSSWGKLGLSPAGSNGKVDWGKPDLRAPGTTGGNGPSAPENQTSP